LFQGERQLDRPTLRGEKSFVKQRNVARQHWTTLVAGALLNKNSEILTAQHQLEPRNLFARLLREIGIGCD